MDDRLRLSIDARRAGTVLFSIAAVLTLMHVLVMIGLYNNSLPFSDWRYVVFFDLDEEMSPGDLVQCHHTAHCRSVAVAAGSPGRSSPGSLLEMVDAAQSGLWFSFPRRGMPVSRVSEHGGGEHPLDDLWGRDHCRAGLCLPAIPAGLVSAQPVALYSRWCDVVPET